MFDVTNMSFQPVLDFWSETLFFSYNWKENAIVKEKLDFFRPLNSNLGGLFRVSFCDGKEGG